MTTYVSASAAGVKTAATSSVAKASVALLIMLRMFPLLFPSPRPPAGMRRGP